METIADIIKKVNSTPANVLVRRPKLLKTEECLPLVEAIGKRIIPSFTLDGDNRKVYERFTSWVLCSPEGDLDLYKGIYLAGPVGTGKTICMSVMKAFASQIGAYLSIGDRTDYLSWKTWRTTEVCSNYAASGDLSPYKEARVACFEDLGAEPMETLYMGNRVNVMREIIEYRGDQRGLLTMFTSNVPIDRLAAVGQTIRYGQRVQSRVLEMCNFLTLVGADRRK